MDSVNLEFLLNHIISNISDQNWLFILQLWHQSSSFILSETVHQIMFQKLASSILHFTCDSELFCFHDDLLFICGKQQLASISTSHLQPLTLGLHSLRSYRGRCTDVQVQVYKKLKHHLVLDIKLYLFAFVSFQFHSVFYECFYD